MPPAERIYDRARGVLEAAWQGGYRTPDVAYALARVACFCAFRLLDRAQMGDLEAPLEPALAVHLDEARTYSALSRGQTWEPAGLGESRLAYLQGEFQHSVSAHQEDVSTLNFGQRQRGLEQRGQHPVHLCSTVELPGSLKKPTQLFQVRVLRADSLQVGEDVRFGPCVLIFGHTLELRAFKGPELNSVSRLERVLGHPLAVHKCPMTTICVFKNKSRAVGRDRSVAARNIGLGKFQIAI